MKFITIDRDLFFAAIAAAIRHGLTFEASEERGHYVINYTGGY